MVQDQKALAIHHKRPRWFGDDIWKGQRYLHKKKGMPHGFDISIDVFASIIRGA
ncbi:serine O-acetyltransferase [Bacillus xiamenensis]|nr:serine O-acetyltransferase [Bacillus xiamenensis]